MNQQTNNDQPDYLNPNRIIIVTDQHGNVTHAYCPKAWGRVDVDLWHQSELDANDEQVSMTTMQLVYGGIKNCSPLPVRARVDQLGATGLLMLARARAFSDTGWSLDERIGIECEEAVDGPGFYIRYPDWRGMMTRDHATLDQRGVLAFIAGWHSVDVTRRIQEQIRA